MDCEVKIWLLTKKRWKKTTTTREGEEEEEKIDGSLVVTITVEVSAVLRAVYNRTLDQ